MCGAKYTRILRILTLNLKKKKEKKRKERKQRNDKTNQPTRQKEIWVFYFELLDFHLCIYFRNDKFNLRHIDAGSATVYMYETELLLVIEM